jgi:hypothetical protein
VAFDRLARSDLGGMTRWALLLAASCGGGIAVEGKFDRPPPPPPPPPTKPIHASPQKVALLDMIGDAISEVALTPEQESHLYSTVEDVRGRHKSVLSLRTTLAIDIATSVEHGKIDEKQIFLDAEQLGKERALVENDDARAIEDLHDTLGPEQRVAFAHALRDAADRVKLDDFRTRYGTWRNDLRITTHQDAVIEPRLRTDTRSATEAQTERAARQKRMRDLADAFAKPKLVAGPFLDPDVERTTEHRVHRLVAFLEIVLPELDADQRDKAASFIRADAGISVRMDPDED